MKDRKILLTKRLGEKLEMAHLLSPSQLEVALMDQTYYDMKLGEILILRGWLKRKTVDFFAEDLSNIIQHNSKKKIGEYLKLAALLDDIQIRGALLEQEKRGLHFGEIILSRGWLKKETLDFFLEYLANKNINNSTFMYNYKRILLNNLEAKLTDNQDKKIIPQSEINNQTKIQTETQIQTDNHNDNEKKITIIPNFKKLKREDLDLDSTFILEF